jgi:hypothetical protein
VTGSVCIGEPISWLRLERHRLGELPVAEARSVAAHLAACPVCAACDAEIARPMVLRPLTIRRPDSFDADALPRAHSVWRRSFGRIAVGAAAAAAAVLLLWFARTGDGPDRYAAMPLPGLKGIKGGGDAVLTLVRDRQGMIQHDPVTFSPVDRWKALVTCSSARVQFWEVVVDEGSTLSFPLSPTAPIACGNSVPLPGAFRLSARAPVRICLLLGDNPVDRSALRSELRPHLRLAGDRPEPSPARQAICVALRPEATGSALSR